MRSAALNRLALALAPGFGATAIRLLGATLRLTTAGAHTLDELYGRGQHVIIAFWHGRQFMMPLGYRGRQACVLISQHRDGELIARLIHRFGARSIRGSSTRGGTAAFRHLIALSAEGADLVVTPDGPKGPRGVVKPGVIHLAKATGLPIMPVTFGSSKKKSLRAGTGSKCPIRFAERRSSGGRRSGWTRTPTTIRSRWRVAGWSAC